MYGEYVTRSNCEFEKQNLIFDEQLEHWGTYVDEACLRYPRTLKFFGRDYFMGRIL